MWKSKANNQCLHSIWHIECDVIGQGIIAAVEQGLVKLEAQVANQSLVISDTTWSAQFKHGIWHWPGLGVRHRGQMERKRLHIAAKTDHDFFTLELPGCGNWPATPMNVQDQSIPYDCSKGQLLLFTMIQTLWLARLIVSFLLSQRLSWSWKPTIRINLCVEH